MHLKLPSCFLIYLRSFPNRSENKAKPHFRTFQHNTGHAAPRNQRQTCLKQNASYLLLLAEAKLSNFGINETSVWKTTSVETASSTLLAIYLAELTEAITRWSMLQKDSFIQYQIHLHKSASGVTRQFQNIWVVQIHSVI